MPLFDRTISVIIGEPGTTGVLIDENDIDFEIEKSAEGAPNQGSCQIYGLTETTRSRFKGGRDVMVINAGYRESDTVQIPLRRESVRLCCALDVFDVRIESKPPDIVTVVAGGDGLHTQRTKKLSVSYSAGKTAKQIIKELAANIGVALQDPQMSTVTDDTFANGFSEMGPIGDILDVVCAKINSIWSFQDGQLQIATRDTPVTDQVVVLNQHTGLIQKPQKRNKVQSIFVPIVRPGWIVTSLLNPLIVPNGRVHLQAEEVDAVYRVLNVKHSGSSRGQEFYSVADIAEW